MHSDVVHPGEVLPLGDVVHPDEVPPLEEMVQLVEKVPLDVVLLEEMVQPDEVPPLEEVVHLNRVLLNVVQSKPALSMLVESMPVNLDEVQLEGEVPLDVVHSDKVPPLEEVVQLKEVVRLNKVLLDVVQASEPRDSWWKTSWASCTRWKLAVLQLM